VKKDLAKHDYNTLDEVLLRVLARGRARAKRGGDVDGCILVHQTCSLHFGLDLIMELTRH
jgi:hypothetical protein